MTSERENIEIMRQLTEDFFKEIVTKVPRNLEIRQCAILQVVKLILLKEKFVKKDSENHCIVFRGTKEQLHELRALAHYIKKHATQLNLGNDLSVITLDENGNKFLSDIQVKQDLLILHRLRDALAHGHFKLSENGDIEVSNQSRSIKNPYKIKCTIPLIEFINISFSLENMSRIRRLLPYLDTENEAKKFIEESYYKYLNTLRLKEEDKKLLKLNQNFIEDKKQKIIRKDSIEKNKYIREKQSEEEQSNKAPKNNLSLYEYIIKSENIETKKIAKRIKEKIKSIEKNDSAQDYSIIMQEVMRDISALLELEEKKDHIVSLYGYMTFLFACSEISNIKKIEALNFHGLDIFNQGDSDITKIKQDLEKFISDKNKEMAIPRGENGIGSCIEKAMQDSESIGKAYNLSKEYSKIMEQIIKKTSNINTKIYSHLRNAIEHGNFELQPIEIQESDSQQETIILEDKKNQLDSTDSSQFLASVTPQDLFNIGKQIENNRDISNLTLENFIGILSGLVEDKNVITIFRNNIMDIHKLIFKDYTDEQILNTNIYDIIEWQRESYQDFRERLGIKQNEVSSSKK